MTARRAVLFATLAVCGVAILAERCRAQTAKDFVTAAANRRKAATCTRYVIEYETTEYKSPPGTDKLNLILQDVTYKGTADIVVDPVSGRFRNDGTGYFWDRKLQQLVKSDGAYLFANGEFRARRHPNSGVSDAGCRSLFQKSR